MDTQEVVIANQLQKRKIRQNPTEARNIHVTETSGKRLNSASGELRSLIMTRRNNGMLIKGMFTREEEDPGKSKILEGGKTFRPVYVQ